LTCLILAKTAPQATQNNAYQHSMSEVMASHFPWI
jgi:hypothetical protein